MPFSLNEAFGLIFWAGQGIASLLYEWDEEVAKYVAFGSAGTGFFFLMVSIVSHIKETFTDRWNTDLFNLSCRVFSAFASSLLLTFIGIMVAKWIYKILKLMSVPICVGSFILLVLSLCFCLSSEALKDTLILFSWLCIGRMTIVLLKKDHMWVALFYFAIQCAVTYNKILDSNLF